MQPSAKAEGEHVGELEGARSEKRCLENCPDTRSRACGGLAAPAARWGAKGWGGCAF